MTCPQSDAHLIDLIHDELDAETQAELLRHLAGCSGCALRFCQLRADLEGVTMSAEAPPPALRRRVRREIERTFRPPLWRRALDLGRRPVPAYGVVVASLAPVIAWVALSFAAGPPSASPTPASNHLPRIIDYDSMVPLTPRDVLL
ncbi:MAG: zf-HC2 domain-containing protein [Nannocystaceae bacterium]